MWLILMNLVIILYLINIDSNIIIFNLSILSNCCHSFLGEAEIKNNTLNLIYTEYGEEFCGCLCCFTIEYRFNILESKQISLPKYVSVNSSKPSKLISK